MFNGELEPTKIVGTVLLSQQETTLPNSYTYGIGEGVIVGVILGVTLGVTAIVGVTVGVTVDVGVTLGVGAGNKVTVKSPLLTTHADVGQSKLNKSYLSFNNL